MKNRPLERQRQPGNFKKQTRFAAVCLGFTSLALIACNLASVIWTPMPKPTAGGANQTTGSLPPVTPPAEPVPTEPSLPVNLNKRLVGYFTSWSIYARGYHASDIPAGRLTHLNYAFTVVSDDGLCASGDAHADQVNIPELRKLKQDYPHLRLLVSIGGRGMAEKFSSVSQTDEARKRFTSSCIQWMQQNGFDGIDLDWEFPANEEKGNYTALLTEFRRQLDTLQSGEQDHYLFTIAVGASPYQYDDLELPEIAAWVDWINLMTYDFHGPWNKVTGFNAPLYPVPGDPSPSSIERNTFTIDAAVQAYLQRGVPADKIVLGVPFYGYGWQGVPVGDGTQPGLFQEVEEPSTGTWGGGGTYDYKDLAENYLTEASGYSRYWNEDAKVPWLYNPAKGIWITYDDPDSLAVKVEYARSMGLGGMMVWQLNTDDSQHTLLNSIFENLSK